MFQSKLVVSIFISCSFKKPEIEKSTWIKACRDEMIFLRTLNMTLNNKVWYPSSFNEMIYNFCAGQSTCSTKLFKTFKRFLNKLWMTRIIHGRKAKKTHRGVSKCFVFFFQTFKDYIESSIESYTFWSGSIVIPGFYGYILWKDFWACNQKVWLTERSRLVYSQV